MLSSLFSGSWMTEMWSGLILLCLFSFLAPNMVSAIWCTKLMKKEEVKTYMDYGTCNKSYQASCSWFGSEQCTYYEEVKCPKQRNMTVIMYKIVEFCCPGYKLDPENNSTCIEDASQPRVNMKGDPDIHSSHHGNGEEEELLMGLSHGAYAGIICALLFVLCITILVFLHLRKRYRKPKEDPSNTAVSFEVQEKLVKMPDA